LSLGFVIFEKVSIRQAIEFSRICEHVEQRHVFLKKLAAAGTSVETTSVRGGRAYFLSGEPHEVLLLDDYGLPVHDTLRLARNTLLWQQDGRTLRLEGDFSRDEAVTIAESLR